MEFKFIERDTIIDVQVYAGVVDLDNLAMEFTCKFVDVYKDVLLMMTGSALEENLELLTQDHVLVFNFFRGAFGYRFTGKIGDMTRIDGNILVQATSKLEQYSRRRYPRIDLSTFVSVFALATDGTRGEMIATESSLDISRGGIAIVTSNTLNQQIQIGHEYVLDFKLGNLTFSLLAACVHSGDVTSLFSYKFLHAFEFKNLTDYQRLENAMFKHRLSM